MSRFDVDVEGRLRLRGSTGDCDYEFRLRASTASFDRDSDSESDGDREISTSIVRRESMSQSNLESSQSQSKLDVAVETRRLPRSSTSALESRSRIRMFGLVRMPETGSPVASPSDVPVIPADRTPSREGAGRFRRSGTCSTAPGAASRRLSG